VEYIGESLIETTLSRDILLMTPEQKPALLRRLFQLACHYSGQILSYQKMVGQLQEAGNTTTLAHYLDLLQGAGLAAGLDKYANQLQRRRSSSPKLAVFNTALMSFQSELSFEVHVHGVGVLPGGGGRNILNLQSSRIATAMSFSFKLRFLQPALPMNPTPLVNMYLSGRRAKTLPFGVASRNRRWEPIYSMAFVDSKCDSTIGGKVIGRSISFCSEVLQR